MPNTAKIVTVVVKVNGVPQCELPLAAREFAVKSDEQGNVSGGSVGLRYPGGTVWIGGEPFTPNLMLTRNESGAAPATAKKPARKGWSAAIKAAWVSMWNGQPLTTAGGMPVADEADS